MVSAASREKTNLANNLFHYLDVLSEAKLLSRGPLDEALLLEDILIGWSRLFRTVV